MSGRQSSGDGRWAWAVVGSAGVSAAGLFVHNVADLPGQTLLSPESLYPILFTVALVAAWFTPIRRIASWALLGWAALNLVGGGIVSVLPLPVLPFDPEQSWRHYAFHLLYVVSQLPLLIVTARWLQRHRRPPRPQSSAP
ncbi:MAG: hypothetical protein ABWZ98_00970 [Nakamurella sp.]